MAHIKSLYDEAVSDDDNKKQTQSYAGGEKSGIAIENPIDSISKDRVMQGDASDAAAIITIYRNGLLCNGEFYPRDDPRAKKIVDDMKKGYLPQGLINSAPDEKEVQVAVQQRTFEDYDDSNLSEIAILDSNDSDGPEQFPGEGKSLGGPTAAVPIAPKSDGQTAKIDDSKKTTTIKVRFIGGETRSQIFNEDASVESVYQWVESESDTNQFDLAGGFPPKPVERSSKSIKESKLLNGVFTMRSKKI